MPIPRLIIPTIGFILACAPLGAQQLVNAYPNLTFAEPIFLTGCGDGSNRIFVATQTGLIKVFPNDSAATTAATFLDISSKLAGTSGELGLLGLAFHPRYAQNGYFYVDYTADNPLRTVVARYHVSAGNPNVADPSSAYVIIEIPQPYSNHNAGMLAFGPSDGYLYIALGDGGSEGDPLHNGQNPSTLLSKILRIDVNDTTATTHYAVPPDNPYANGAGGFRPETWAYGFRNPWRFSFDPFSGRLWVGDVGQDTVEEIDIVTKGRNYGWSIMEGTLCYNPPSGCDTVGLALPVAEYFHPTGNAVVGGYVYRGYRRPDLGGAYIYGDYGTGKIWVLRYTGGAVTVDSLLVQLPHQVSSFGEDELGELYVCAYNTGQIYRFSGRTVTDTVVPPPPNLIESYPNPFSAETSVRYDVTSPGAVSVKIYDVSGRLVRVLVEGLRPRGTFVQPWDGTGPDGSRVASGIYVCRFETGSAVRATKIILMR